MLSLFIMVVGLILSRVVKIAFDRWKENKENSNSSIDSFVFYHLSKMKNSVSPKRANQKNRSESGEGELESQKPDWRLYDIYFDHWREVSVQDGKKSFERVLLFLKDLYRGKGSGLIGVKTQFSSIVGHDISNGCLLEACETLLKSKTIEEGNPPLYKVLVEKMLVSIATRELLEIAENGHDINNELLCTLEAKTNIEASKLKKTLTFFFLTKAQMSSNACTTLIEQSWEKASLKLTQLTMSKKENVVFKLCREIDDFSQLCSEIDKAFFKFSNFKDQEKEKQNSKKERFESPPEADAIESSSDYVLLGCKEGDSLHHIKKSYRKLALKKHPDQVDLSNLSESECKVVHEEFVKIKSAYEKIVSDLKKAS